MRVKAKSVGSVLRRCLLARLFMITSAALTVVAVPVSLNLAINTAQYGDDRAWVGSVILGIVGVTLSVATAMIFYREASISNTEYECRQYDMEATFFGEFIEIERTAKDMLSEVDGASIIRIRASLGRLRKWSEADITEFDKALRVRNKVAHGDTEALDDSSIKDALATVRHLRQKL